MKKFKVYLTMIILLLLVLFANLIILSLIKDEILHIDRVFNVPNREVSK